MKVTNGGTAAAASKLTSSLDTLETSDQTAPVERPRNEAVQSWPQTASQKRLHERWYTERSHIISSLLAGDLALSRRGLRLENCCSHPAATRRKNGTLGLALFTCRDRMCPRCQRARGMVASARIEAVIREMNAPRKIELTVRHKHASLRREIERLWSAWKDLRKTKMWQKHVRGGLVVLEVTKNKKDRTWHPHLHIVYDGEFLPQKVLSDEWLRITGDSNVVWIEAIHDRAAAAKYVGRYLAKPGDFRELQPVEVREYAETMHGRRMVATFGKTHGRNVDPAGEDEAVKHDETLISLHRLVDAAESGHAAARKAVELLRAVSWQWNAALGYLPLAVAQKPEPLTQANERFVVETCIAVRNEQVLQREGYSGVDAAEMKHAMEVEQLRMFDEAPQPQRYT